MTAHLTDRREYSGGAVQQITTTDMTNTSMVVNIDASTNWPTAAAAAGGFYVLIAEGTAAEEKMLVSGRTGNQLTISARGADGSTAFAHPAGAKIRCWYAAKDADEANYHTSNANDVHGVAGNVLGDVDAQAVYNKTLDGTNAFTDFTLSLHDHSSAADGGATAPGVLQAPTYNTGWSATGGIYSTPGWRQDSSGYVKIQGTYAAGSGATQAVATGFPHPLDASFHAFNAVDILSVSNIIAGISATGALTINTGGAPVVGHSYVFEFGYQA